jgi:hypothetical protein
VTPDDTPTSTLIIATPTFTDEVQGSTPTAGPSTPNSPSGGDGATPETGAGLPDTGDGDMNPISFAATMLAFALIIIGIATIVGGKALRAKK